MYNNICNRICIIKLEESGVYINNFPAMYSKLLSLIESYKKRKGFEYWIAYNGAFPEFMLLIEISKYFDKVNEMVFNMKIMNLYNKHRSNKTEVGLCLDIDTIN